MLIEVVICFDFEVGSIVVVFKDFFFYYVIVLGWVICYGVVVGMVELVWKGCVIVGCKIEWFSWMLMFLMIKCKFE